MNILLDNPIMTRHDICLTMKKNAYEMVLILFLDSLKAYTVCKPTHVTAYQYIALNSLLVCKGSLINVRAPERLQFTFSFNFCRYLQ